MALTNVSRFFSFKAPLSIVKTFLTALKANVEGYPAPPTLNESSNAN